MLKKISLLIFISIFFSANSYAGMKDVGKCYPKKNDFHGNQLSTTSDRWQMKRARNTGGASKGDKMYIPDGRVVVQWSTKRTSCNSRCTSPAERLIFKKSGPIQYPVGTEAAVRWKKDLNPFGPGGIYSGNVTMLHVPIDAWKKVFLEKYFSCS